MSEEINHSRRSLISHAALTIAAAKLGILGCASTPPAMASVPGVTTTGSATSRSFGPSKQITAGVLNVGYVDVGPVDGPPVVLLHGWPYDIHSYAEVAPLLASAGYRVIVPHLRGYGSTRFLSSETLRNAQQSAFALDTVALMDALGRLSGPSARGLSCP